MTVHSSAVELISVSRQLVQCIQAILSFEDAAEWMTPEQIQNLQTVIESYERVIVNATSIANRHQPVNQYSRFSAPKINTFDSYTIGSSAKAKADQESEARLIEHIQEAKTLLRNFTGTLNFGRERQGLPPVGDDSRPIN